MVKFIDDERHNYGVELICRVLPITPSTYYAYKDKQANPEKQSKRMQNDAYLLILSRKPISDANAIYNKFGELVFINFFKKNKSSGSKSRLTSDRVIIINIREC